MEMVIRAAEVVVKGNDGGGKVVLALVQTGDGWTYAVDGVAGGEFTLLWRADTPEMATEKLRETYPEDIFSVTVAEGE